MAVAERGSFLWLMVAVTQIWLSIKLLAEAEEAIATLFGGGAAACFVLALIVFRQEQRDLLLTCAIVCNPFAINFATGTLAWCLQQAY